MRFIFLLLTPFLVSLFVIEPCLGQSIVLRTNPDSEPGDERPAALGIEQIARQELEKSIAGAGPVGERAAQPEGGIGGVQPGDRCLPSCASNDGRFLAIATGASLVTVSRPTLDIEFGVPEITTSFSLGIFDGDADSANGNWDVGSAPFSYSIFADPDRDGSGDVLIAGPFASTAMPNNGWFEFAITPGPEAQAPNGNYFYHLLIENLDESQTVLNSFKVRSQAVLSIDVAEQPFGFYAALQSLGDANIIFPFYPDREPTTYDGVFDFHIDVRESQTELVIWDGDLDHGAWDQSTMDTDDPDTPNAPFLPPWAAGGAVSEGVAVGEDGATGSPADDRSPAGLGSYLQRSPSIDCTVLDPNGLVHPNPNPSGNREWEQFRLATGSFDPTTTDVPVTSLPAGTYRVRSRGVDLQNLNLFRFSHPVLCVRTCGMPCLPLFDLKVGKAVFSDLDGDGVQDDGEPGIQGVEIELLDSRGAVLATQVTDASGHYSFEVTRGKYTVRVTKSSSNPGRALEGRVSTTGSSFSGTLSDENVLHWDFGY